MLSVLSQKYKESSPNENRNSFDSMGYFFIFLKWRLINCNGFFLI
jgi:hypothetical protein